MIVEADPDRFRIVLREAEDFETFKVVVIADSLDDARIRELFALDAWLDSSNDIFVRVDAITRWAGPLAHDPDWLAGLDAMVAYAQARGWLNAEGTAVRAHYELT